MVNKSPKAHLGKKYKNTGLSLPECLPLTFTAPCLRRGGKKKKERKKKSLLCMRYRPSVAGSESQRERRGGEGSVPSCIRSQRRA